MTKRSEVIVKLHEMGLTYEQIGDMFGVSKQAIHHASVERDGFRPSTIGRIKYVGLRNWMFANRCKLSDLEKMVGGSRRLSSCLTGKHEPGKKTIDAILRVTGLTYEECFKEDET